MEKRHVAIFPMSAAMGHLLPVLQFAKRLCEFHGFSITLIISRWMWKSQQLAVLDRLAYSALDIRLIEIPDVTMEEDEEDMKIETLTSKFVLKAKPHVEEALQSLLASSPISAFLTDMFCTDLLDTGAKLNLPTYFFLPGSASVLCLLMHLPTLVSEIEISFKDADFEVEVPGLPPVPARDLPTPTQDRSNSAFKWFVHHSSRFKEASGLLVNTFAELEEDAIKALKSAPGTPPIYPIGPLLLTQSDSPDLKWLDQYPPSSVLFVSFGSVGILSREQIIDLAIGLEASGQRFLWVLRGYRSGDSSCLETDISQLLPEGFGSRTSDRGLIVLNWMPQVAVLSHPSTGGFLSHCGWNSTLESVCHGVPMIAWPLFAEQGMNKAIVVKQLQVAVDLQIDKEGFVRREEVERAVRELMEGEEGRKAREKMKELKGKAKMAVMEGGSTVKATARFAADLSASTLNAK